VLFEVESFLVWMLFECACKNSSSLGIYFKGLMLNFVLEFELNVFPCTRNYRFFKFSAHMDFGSSAKLLRLWICVKLICWYFCKN
jgi:hypothetical protein